MGSLVSDHKLSSSVSRGSSLSVVVSSVLVVEFVPSLLPLSSEHGDSSVTLSLGQTVGGPCPG